MDDTNDQQRVIVTMTLPDGTVLDTYTHVMVPSDHSPMQMADHAILKVASVLYRLDVDSRHTL